LKPWLRLNLYEYLFSPAEAEAQRDAERRAARKTPLYPSSLRQKRKRNPKKAPGVRYTALSYSQAIRIASKKAAAAARAKAIADGMPAEQASTKVFVPRWHPNQLRHTHATEVRRRFGLEAAQVALGHAQASITEVYAERDLGLAVKVAAEIG
jgi:integrase